MTKNDWCGVGYYCDENDIAEDCMVKSMLALTGLNSVPGAIQEAWKDKMGKVATGPAGKMWLGKWLGKKAAAMVLKKAGGCIIPLWCV